MQKNGEHLAGELLKTIDHQSPGHNNERLSNEALEYFEICMTRGFVPR